MRAKALIYGMALSLWPLSVATAGMIVHDYLAVQEGRSDVASSLDPADGGKVEVKVIYGDVADWNSEFNSVVRIEYISARGPSVCTGVLVGEKAVLTAGHCSCGTNYLLRLPEEKDARKISGYPRPYPGFSCHIAIDRQSAPDLSLIRLIDSIGGRQARIAHLLDLQKFTAITRLAVIGFGKDETGAIQDRPRIGQVPIFSFFCSSGMAAASICRPFREFALSGAGLDTADEKVDTCDGDSGGPVFAFRRKAKHEIIGQELASGLPEVQEKLLVGITSRAMRGVANIVGLNCGGGGIYTSIGNSAVVGWLVREGVPVDLVSQVDMIASGNQP